MSVRRRTQTSSSDVEPRHGELVDGQRYPRKWCQKQCREWGIGESQVMQHRSRVQRRAVRETQRAEVIDTQVEVAKPQASRVEGLVHSDRHGRVGRDRERQRRPAARSLQQVDEICRDATRSGSSRPRLCSARVHASKRPGQAARCHCGNRPSSRAAGLSFNLGTTPTRQARGAAPCRARGQPGPRRMSRRRANASAPVSPDAVGRISHPTLSGREVGLVRRRIALRLGEYGGSWIKRAPSPAFVLAQAVAAHFVRVAHYVRRQQSARRSGTRPDQRRSSGERLRREDHPSSFGAACPGEPAKQSTHAFAVG